MARLLARAVTLAFTLALAAAAVAQADVGTPGATYSARASAPTADKPQSKLWYHDGSWWGVMYDRSRLEFDIFERRSGSWVSTGIEIDQRDHSWADAGWDGNHLNIVSAGNLATDPGAGVRYSRFAYDSANHAYTRDVDPITLTDYGVEGAVMDRDSSGRVWVTFTHNSTVMVTHTTTGDQSWTTPTVLGTATTSTVPVATAAGKTPKPPKGGGGPVKVTPDDMSTVVSYGDKVGVLWGNQNDGTYYFASHANGDPDNHWTTSKALSGNELSDDHMNVKALENDRAGQVFAVLKTSLNAPNDPMIMLSVMDARGHWRSYTVWKIGEGHNTRAQISIDPVKRMIYVFSTSPCCNGGQIYMKKSSLDSIAFAPGPGTPVLASSTDTHINNASTTKQTVSGASGLALIAGDDATRRYWHTLLPLDGAAGAPDTEITNGPSGVTTDSTATFSFVSSASATGFMCGLDGANLAPCTSPVTYGALTEGDHSFAVAAVDAAGNVDPTPAERTWSVSSTSALFRDGFELGDFEQWSALRTGVDGTAAVQSAVVQAGTQAARLSSTSTLGSYAYMRKDLVPAPTALTVGAWLRIDGDGASGGNVPLLRLYDPSGVRLLTLYRPNGFSRLWVGHSGITAQTRGTLATATWSRLEVEMVTAGDGASTLTVRQDGVEIYSTPTASLGTAGVGRLQIGNDTKAQPFVVYADDVLAR